MAYNAAAQCTISNRVQAMAVAIPALLVTVVAGPVAWVWILRLDSAKRRYDAAAGGGEDKSHSCDDEDKDDDRKDKDNNDDNNEVGRDKDKDDEYQGDEGKEKGANDDKADVDKDSDNDDDGKDQDKPKDEDNNEVGKQDNSLRFLTGSYQERYNYWEACRLSKSMALAAISAMSPASYCPGQKLALALVVMGLFLLGHSACHPYANSALNRVEQRALAVLALGMVAAVWLAGESWSKTPEMEQAVLLGTAFVLFVAEAFLICYFLYAKFVREEVAAGAELRAEQA